MMLQSQFNEGILPICQNEAGIAVVMSHEVAHALARHGGERMSHGAATKVGAGILKVVTRRSDSREQDQILQAYGLASKYGAILPYSRKHESEADAIGLMLMAKAGYEPEEAVRFWERFAVVKQGNQPIEFFSTHPADARRAAELRLLLPESQEHYVKAENQYGTGEVIETEIQRVSNEF